jgi:hypothetical protein
MPCSELLPALHVGFERSPGHGGASRARRCTNGLEPRRRAARPIGRMPARLIRAAVVLALLVFTAPAEAIVLISPEEAALPAGEIPELNLRGSPTRRPTVIIVSPPAHAGLVRSPLHLIMRFRAFGGAGIDSDSVVVTYKKTPAIDITQRIIRFISEDGIDVPQAEVPPGVHKFRIQLKDRSGRAGAADFDFQVAK